MKRERTIESEKTRYYVIGTFPEDSSSIIYLSGNLEPYEVARIFMALQFRAYEVFGYEFDLSPLEFSTVLIQKYNFRKEQIIPLSDETTELWVANLRDDDISTVANIFGLERESEYLLIELFNARSCDDLFINVTPMLPKWGFEAGIEPLSLQVTHNGVLVNGTDYLTDCDKEKIRSHFKKVKFYGEYGIFFSFRDFPPYQYSFEWDGRCINICEVKEYEDVQTEVIKKLRLGYFITFGDMKEIDLNDYELLKRKMRLR